MPVAGNIQERTRGIFFAEEALGYVSDQLAKKCWHSARLHRGEKKGPGILALKQGNFFSGLFF